MGMSGSSYETIKNVLSDKATLDMRFKFYNAKGESVISAEERILNGNVHTGRRNLSYV